MTGRVRSEQIPFAEKRNVFVREAEDVVKVGCYAAKVAVDEVKRADKVLGANTHKSLNDIHFLFPAAFGDNILIKAADQRAIGLVAEVEVLNNDILPHPESEEEKSRSPACAVLALGAVPENTTVFRRLDNEPQEGSILQLRELAADEGRIHVGRHQLNFGVEGVVDNMAVKLKEGLLGNRLARLLLRAHVNGGQEVVLHPIHPAVGLELLLSDRAEIENAAEVIEVFEALYVRVGGIV